MLVWMQTVTDRSQSDVDRMLELLQKGWDNFNVDEKTEWLAGMKKKLRKFFIKMFCVYIKKF